MDLEAMEPLGTEYTAAWNSGDPSAVAALHHATLRVKSQNWTAVALDFVIVVVGVFIGIQVSNWNDFRRDRTDERLILQELRQSLAADESKLSAVIDRLNSATSDMSELRAHMMAGTPYDRALDQKFGVIYGAIDLTLNTGPYEQLMAGRLSLIRNNELRSQIVDVFDNIYSLAEKYTNEIQVKIILDKYWPYFMNNFHDIVQWETATPHDYDVLIAARGLPRFLLHRSRRTPPNGPSRLRACAPARSRTPVLTSPSRREDVWISFYGAGRQDAPRRHAVRCRFDGQRPLFPAPGTVVCGVQMRARRWLAP